MLTSEPLARAGFDRETCSSQEAGAERVFRDRLYVARLMVCRKSEAGKVCDSVEWGKTAAGAASRKLDYTHQRARAGSPATSKSPLIAITYWMCDDRGRPAPIVASLASVIEILVNSLSCNRQKSMLYSPYIEKFLDIFQNFLCSPTNLVELQQSSSEPRKAFIRLAAPVAWGLHA